jgi:hypothetical protein
VSRDLEKAEAAARLRTPARQDHHFWLTAAVIALLFLCVFLKREPSPSMLEWIVILTLGTGALGGGTHVLKARGLFGRSKRTSKKTNPKSEE